MRAKHIGIRADGSSEIGYGHLVRTGALAEKFLQHSHEVTYLTRTPSTVSDICPGAVSIHQLGDDEVDDTVDWLERKKPDALLTDSYNVDTEYQRQLSESVSPLVTITDDSRFTLCCDVNLNGNVHAPELNYEWDGGKPEMLLGPDYLLVREQFRQLAKKTPPWRDSPQRALVTFGGSDVNNVTPSAMRALDGFDGEVNVIIGPGFTNEDEILEAVDSTDAQFDLLRDPDNLPELMFDSDFAVSAGGSTVYELLSTGTPTIGIPQSDNQVPIIQSLAEKDAILAIEAHGEVSAATTDSSLNPKLLNLDMEELSVKLRKCVERMVTDSSYRRALRDRGTSMIDGNGVDRIYERITRLIE